MKKIIILSFIMFFICINSSYSSPFSSKKQLSNKNSDVSSISSLWVKSQIFQAKANRKMSFYIKDISSNGFKSEYLLTLFGLAFIYGVVHAVGPGHGKIITASYFVGAEKTKFIHAFYMAGVFALSHIFSAVFIVLVSDNILKATLGKSSNELMAIKYISYGIITLMGLYIMFSQIIKKKNNKNICCISERKEVFAIGFFGGLIPCAGATLIMLYSLAKGVVLYGVLTCLALALGIFVTVMFVGIVSIFIKDRIYNLPFANKLQSVSRYLKFLSGMIILILGVILLRSV